LYCRAVSGSLGSLPTAHAAGRGAKRDITAGWFTRAAV
jgi:hypothetical protein